MKKTLAVSLGLLVLLLVGIYFLLPETLFNLTVKAGRHSAGLAKKGIQVDDHKIVYLEGGKGQTILLIHGFAANKDNWIRFAKYLTNDYHVVFPDIPGFGESSQIQNESYAAENQLKRIDRFTEALKLERFHVAGNSMGGMLAAMYGAKYPQKVLTLAPYLPKIQAPVFIIWGDADKILDVGGVAVLEKNLKNYQTVIMKNTGHTPMLEKPQETASYYLNHLKGKIKLYRTGLDLFFMDKHYQRPSPFSS